MELRRESGEHHMVGSTAGNLPYQVAGGDNRLGRQFSFLKIRNPLYE
jgi:hypothetical protein